MNQRIPALLSASGALLLGACLFPTHETAESARNETAAAAVAASDGAIYVAWDKAASGATEIGAGSFGKVWIAANDYKEMGTRTLKFWNGSAFQAPASGGFGYIAEVGGPTLANPDFPDVCYTIGSDSKLYATTTYYGGGWNAKPGITVSDIGVNVKGDLWALGTASVGSNNDRAIYQWIGKPDGSGSWKKHGGGGVKIDVDPNGNPWIVNNAGAIYEGVLSNGTLNFLLHSQITASDIAIGGDGGVWVLGKAQAYPSGDKAVYRWYPDEYKFRLANGGGKRLTVDKAGNPWLVNTVGDVYRSFGFSIVN